MEQLFPMLREYPNECFAGIDHALYEIKKEITEEDLCAISLKFNDVRIIR